MTRTYDLSDISPFMKLNGGFGPWGAFFDPWSDGPDCYRVRFASNETGFWLYAQNPANPRETELSGGEALAFAGVDLIEIVRTKKQDGVGGTYYGLPGGRPFLPLPCTAAQLIEFDCQIGGWLTMPYRSEVIDLNVSDETTGIRPDESGAADAGEPGGEDGDHRRWKHHLRDFGIGICVHSHRDDA